MSRNGKVIVAMSGGVDSSVTACLLKEQGYDCVGVFMWVGEAADTEQAVDWDDVATGDAADDRVRIKQGCCSLGDACDARAVAKRLDMPFYSINFKPDFDRIIEYFVDEYAAARTPNPCVMCNTFIKFGKLLHYADTVGAEFVATGHYARIVDVDGRPCLARGVNRDKDQSYVLFGIRRENLGRCLFPMGDYADKMEVRSIAASLGLRVHAKPDSQEICFVPDNNYKNLVRQRRPETVQPGQVRDDAGNVLGEHEGIVNYTIGQRRGLRIATGKPIYVTELDADTNTVTVGPREALLSAGLRARGVNWLVDPPATGDWQTATIKIRHQHEPVPGRFRLLDDGAIEARFDEPQPAVTPGQVAAVYRGDEVLVAGGVDRVCAGRRLSGAGAKIQSTE
jgi:tRNA-specific 2-thiouridylase